MLDLVVRFQIEKNVVEEEVENDDIQPQLSSWSEAKYASVLNILGRRVRNVEEVDGDEVEKFKRKHHEACANENHFLILDCANYYKPEERNQTVYIVVALNHDD